MQNNTDTILVVVAHPDDEVLGCGGMIAKYASLGSVVHVLFMSDGVNSRDGATNKEVTIRQNSAKESSDILGIHSVTFLKFPDNKMDSIPLLDIVKEIEKIIIDLQPNIIYTHHLGDLNIDHQITHRAVITACRPKPGFCIKEIYTFEVPSSTEWQTPGYLTFTPNVYIDISAEMEIKRKALEVYSDEMHQSPHTRSIKNVVRLNALRGNSTGMDYAEAFTLIRCLRD